uniref:Uncharacterized protein n=1 Tax=Glossina palpalis gambiensis TaxID=67801 RepID=A0A1B0BBR7_9MUSC
MSLDDDCSIDDADDDAAVKQLASTQTVVLLLLLLLIPMLTYMNATQQQQLSVDCYHLLWLLLGLAQTIDRLLARQTVPQQHTITLVRIHNLGIWKQSRMNRLGLCLRGKWSQSTSTKTAIFNHNQIYNGTKCPPVRSHIRNAIPSPEPPTWNLEHMELRSRLSNDKSKSTTVNNLRDMGTAPIAPRPATTVQCHQNRWNSGSSWTAIIVENYLEKKVFFCLTKRKGRILCSFYEMRKFSLLSEVFNSITP